MLVSLEKQREIDIRFMKKARLWATSSTCLSRKIGSVLVRDECEISGGANGPSNGLPSCSFRSNDGMYTDEFVSDVCPRKRAKLESGFGMWNCNAVHGEMRSIFKAASKGVSTKGATLYAYCGTPCLNCMKEIIDAGIVRIVCLHRQENSGKNEYNFPLSEQICKLAGVKLDVISEEELDG